MAVFRKKSAAAPVGTSPAPPRFEWDLLALVERVREAAPALEAKEVEPALVQARLADLCRDAGLAPPEPSEFQRQLASLDPEDSRRLALAVAAIDDAGLWAGLASLKPWLPVAAKVAAELRNLSREVAPLTVALVRQSPTRAEEFARHLAMRLGARIAGETEEESRNRLDALDYRRLLAEAEQAHAAGEQKMERLRKKQQEADGLRRRRGKW